MNLETHPNDRSDAPGLSGSNPRAGRGGCIGLFRIVATALVISGLIEAKAEPAPSGPTTRPQEAARPFWAPPSLDLEQGYTGYEASSVERGLRFRSLGAPPFDILLESALACGRPIERLEIEGLPHSGGAVAAVVLGEIDPECSVEVRLGSPQATFQAVGGALAAIGEGGRHIGWLPSVSVIGAGAAPISNAAWVVIEGDIVVRIAAGSLSSTDEVIAVVLEISPEAGPPPLSSSLPREGYEPSLAFNGSYFLGAWQEGKFGKGILAARFSLDGHPLDHDELRISQAREGVWHRGPRVAAGDEESFLIAWTSSTSFSSRLETALVDAENGKVLDRHSGPQDSSYGEPSMAAGRNRFLVAARTSRGTLQAHLLDSSGRFDPEMPTLELPVRGTDLAVDVVYAEGVFLVFWAEGRSEERRVVAVRISEESGRVLDQSPHVLSSPHGIVSEAPAAAVLDGEVLIAWSQGPRPADIRGTWMTLRSGRVHEPRSTFLGPVAGGDTRIIIEPLGGRLLLTWYGGRDGRRWGAWVDRRDLDATLLPQASLPDKGEQVAMASSPSGTLSIWSNNGPMAAVWQEMGETSFEDRSFALRPMPRTGLGVGVAGGDLYSLTCGASCATVTLHHFARNGDVDLLPMSCWSDSVRPALASGPRGLLAACTISPSRLGLIVVPAGGSGPERLLLDSASAHQVVSAAPLSDGFMVAWSDRVAGSSRIRLARVLVDDQGALEVLYTPTEVNAAAAGVASSGQDVLLAWREGSDLTFAWEPPRDGFPKRVTELPRTNEYIGEVVATGNGFVAASPFQVRTNHFGTRFVSLSTDPHLPIRQMSLQTAAVSHPPIVKLTWDGEYLAACWSIATGDTHIIECRWGAEDMDLDGPDMTIRIPGAVLTGLAPISAGKVAIQYERGLGDRNVPVVRVLSRPRSRK